jgi:hypothetical protein
MDEVIMRVQYPWNMSIQLSASSGESGDVGF